MLIDFFSEHKKVSGTISIMLSIILLPLLSLIALLIENSRYQSAREQLDELTYLGELAILADYMDYLANNYDLYAFEGMDSNNVNIAKESFSGYIQSAKSAGGIDTTKLNTLFNFDINYCDVYNMYSIADPTVLEHQIKQYGRYSMPADVLSNYSLNVIFGSINDKFANINKYLKTIDTVTGVADNLTNIIYDGSKLFDETKYLESNIKEYNETHAEYMQLENNVNWNIVDSDEFITARGMTEADKFILETDLSELNKLKSVLEKMEETIEEYYGKNENDRSNMEVMINDDEIYELLRLRDVQNFEYVIGELKRVLSNDFSFLDNIDFDDKNDYDGLIDSAESAISEIDKKLKAYDECQKINELVETYKDLKKKVDTLHGRYNSYIVVLSDYINSATEMIDAFDELKAASESASIDKLNEQSAKASRSESLYEQAVRDSDDEEAIQRLKEEKNEAVKARREAYHEAMGSGDYASVGTNVLENFTAEVTRDVLMEWAAKLDGKISSFPSTDNLNSNSSDEEYIAAVKDIKKANISNYANLVVEKDFFSDNGITYRESSMEAMREELPYLIDDTGFISHLWYDPFTLDNLVTDVYSPFINGNFKLDSEPGENNWFKVSKDQSYYFSMPTIIFLMSFLVSEAKADNDTDIFEIIKTLIEAFANLFPENAAFSSHVGSNYNLPSGAFPSTTSFDNSAESAMLSKAKEYSDGNLPDGIDYYVNGNSQYGSKDIFNGDEPGQSVMDLVKASGDFFSAIDSFIESLFPLKIIKMLKALKDLFVSIGEFVKALIEFVIDLSKIVSKVIDDIENGTVEMLTYIIDQLYIGYYASEHFTSRQTAAGDIKNVQLSMLQGCNVRSGSLIPRQCKTEQKNFLGAKMEYILIGDPCEIINQQYTYYALLCFRMLLNFQIVLSNKVIVGLTSMPFVGPLIPFFALIFESKIDMMFMICGTEVPLFKDKLSILNIKKFIKNAKEILEDERNLRYTMSEDETTGRKYRQYTKADHNKALKDAAEEYLISGDSMNLDYNWYINLILLFYPEKVKALRIADLIQMDISEKRNDDSFRLSNCYTYVGVDVNASYSTFLPFFSMDGSRKGDFSTLPKIRNVQMTGF